MEYLNETVALGVDVLILGLCLKEYISYKNTVKSLENAPQLSIDENLKNIVSKQKDKKIPYAVVRGTVTPLGAPLKSVMTPSVTGVLQVMKLNEHRVARGFAGFWAEQRKLIHVSFNDIPFTLANGNSSIEIVGAQSAEILDMDIVYDNYEPTSLSFFDHIFGFFSGVRQRGIQTTEEILRDGSYMTAIGEIELEGNSLRLQASSEGPMFITTATKNTLLRKMEDAKSSMMFRVVICGAISIFLLSVIGRKFYLKKRQERAERRIREALEKSRHQRRAQSRQKNINDDQRCVVCVQNPKEVIILPCGHVCLCEDCSLQITDNCPVCRAKIDSKAAAFIT